MVPQSFAHFLHLFKDGFDRSSSAVTSYVKAGVASKAGVSAQFGFGDLDDIDRVAAEIIRSRERNGQPLAPPLAGVRSLRRGGRSIALPVMDICSA
jgi:hypothetical protein